ncbi:MAG: hypothetical protein IPH39_18870 [Sulfuritalea sp.]|nr:hypothetical protein [Sulfuritalea sp.]
MKAAGMATRDNPEWAQVNPARAEALLRGYFNTWAMYGLMLTDPNFKDQLPEKRADEQPVVRRFYSQEPAKHTRYESEFYELLTEAKRLRGTMKELDEMGLRGFADAKEKEPLATEAKPLERAAKSLGAINNDMQAARRDQTMTPAEKRQKLDALTIERNALLKQAVTESKAAQKDGANDTGYSRAPVPRSRQGATWRLLQSRAGVAARSAAGRCSSFSDVPEGTAP